MRWGCVGAVDRRNCPYFKRLQRDLATTYYWSGECGRDYLYFVTQWHPLLGIVFCHPNHPWTKFSRLLMFLASLAFTMVPSAAIAHGYGACSSLKPPTSELTLLSKIDILIFVTIPDCIFGYVLYYLKTLPARCWCSCCRRIFHFFASMGTLSLLLFGALMSAVSFVLKHDAAWVCLLGPIFFGKLISWLAWFPLLLLAPCSMGFLSAWNREKRNAAISHQDGQAPMALEEALQMPEESLQTEGTATTATSAGGSNREGSL